MLPVRADEMTMKTLTDNSLNIMKKYLFYIFMALVCAACTLAGCRKDEANKAPEGVFWFPARWQDARKTRQTRLRRECSGLMKVLIQKKYQEP